ncbi:hypothetical protein OPT61_g6366 [Boeremia exigua]|uniref:Uncharacterized protein n=1 Tax=Boeremia exigua TaxID=749465 RepID=A0ACC2I6W0_9PLEO|nr:hypothetical protein OPT61_g6366 [Boeremia exigua]
MADPMSGNLHEQQCTVVRKLFDNDPKGLNEATRKKDANSLEILKKVRLELDKLQELRMEELSGLDSEERCADHDEDLDEGMADITLG